MRKFILFFLILIFFFPSPVLGQAFSDDLNRDLMAKYRLYQNTLEPYKVAKSHLSTYQSVASRAEYLDAAKNLLRTETEAIIVYANLVRTRLVEATSILNYQENLYFIKLDDEIAGVKLMSNQINDISSVSELETFWKSLDEHYRKISNYGYLTKSYIEIGSFLKISDNLKITKDKINGLIAENVSTSTGSKAIKDKFSVLEKTYAEITALLNKAQAVQKNGQTGSDFEGGAKEVRTIINQAVSTTEKIISEYQNIVASLILK